MRVRVLITAAVLPLLAGCEIFEETYTIASEQLFNEDGVQIQEDVEEDFGGTRWFQYSASNSNDFPVCVRVSIVPGGQTNGHSMGSVINIPAFGTEDVGYVYLPANFNLRTQVWGAEADDTCGPPPN